MTSQDKDSAPDISIIIVNYNTRERLRACLESIFSQATDHSFEVLVADNNSRDESAETVAREFPRATLFNHDRNLGFVKANNEAMRSSRGKYILLLNPDTLLPAGALDRLVGFMEARPDAGICGCKQVNADGHIQLTWGRFPTVLSEIQRKARHLRLDLRGRTIHTTLETDLAGQCDVDWVAGSCMLVRREVVDQVGLMDERIFMYFEDIDWCHRVREAGWRVCIDPSTRIVHYGGESAATDKIVSLVEYRRSQFYFLRKYRGRGLQLATRLWVFLKSLGYLAIWAWRYWLSRGPEDQYEAECMSLVYKNIALLAITGRMPSKIER